MRDALPETAGFRVLRVDVQRIRVAAYRGKEQDVRFGDRFGKRDRLADRE